MKMTRTGAMGEDEHGIELTIALCGIERGGDGGVGIPGKLERDRTHN
jgi:hypothetical protein